MLKRFLTALVEFGALMGSEIKNAVELDQVEFAWPGEKPLLSIERLHIAPEERLFIHGPSGSGKSTLLGLIAGIQLPSRGSISVFGTELGRLTAGSRDRLRGNEFGFVFQQFNLVSYLSVLKNVLLPLTFAKTRRERCGGATAARSQALDLLERLGIDGAMAGRKPTELSVGQQQRVAVARALLGGPRLVVCDEPTSALDTDTRNDFLEILLEQSDKAGAAILFVSHDRVLADRFDRSLDIVTYGCARV